MWDWRKQLLSHNTSLVLLVLIRNGISIIVQQPKAIYLANPVLSDKVFFFCGLYIFGCI